MVPKLFSGNPSDWNKLIAGLPDAHFLQTWEWGQVKAANGWEPLPLVWVDETDGVVGAALVLERTMSFPVKPVRFRVQYAPRGPLLRDWGDSALRKSILRSLVEFARQRRAIFVKLDPELPLAYGAPGEADEETFVPGQQLVRELEQTGWIFSSEQIQFRNTIQINLQADEEDLLARMKQKTRYNIRLAARKGVTVRLAGSDDLPLLYRLYAVTSVRDGFVIRAESYYQRVWQTFMQAGLADVLIAEVEGSPVGGLVLFRFAGHAWYVYGMSLDDHREKMPAYLLQWEAIRRARSANCTVYDLWGAPDDFVETDPMWGVYRFKAGLGGQVVRGVGAWDYPVNQSLYWLYMQVLPRVMDVLRRRGRAQNRDVAGV